MQLDLRGRRPGADDRIVDVGEDLARRLVGPERRPPAPFGTAVCGTVGLVDEAEKTFSASPEMTTRSTSSSAARWAAAALSAVRFMPGISMASFTSSSEKR